MIESRYPGFDVMVLKDEWDEHTRHVIDQRMRPPAAPRFFTVGEAGALRAACARLLAETDGWLLDKVVEHIDSRLAGGSGEGYRPEEQPPEAAFWRAGVGRLGEGFAGAPPEQQDQRLKALQQEDPPFFKALLKEAMTGYCSLPPVWSFMGYGGPAFPRGYVRIELGLTDPWEAKQHEHR
jgi:hypothetical protein